VHHCNKTGLIVDNFYKSLKAATKQQTLPKTDSAFVQAKETFEKVLFHHCTTH